MSESKNNENFEYHITQSIMEYEISLDQLDAVLDKHIDKEEVTEDDEQLVVIYCLQLFYRSGRRKTNTEEIYNKYSDLIGGRAIYHMKNLGIIDEVYYSEDEEDLVYSINEKGREIIRELNDL